jgi:hypothetical protein
MVDRVSAFITIGGKLSSQYLPEFLDLIAQEDLSLEWDGEPFEVSQLVQGTPLSHGSRGGAGAIHPA